MELHAAAVTLVVVGRILGQVNGRLEELAVTVRGGLHTGDLAIIGDRHGDLRGIQPHHGILEALELAAEIVDLAGLALELAAEIVEGAIAAADAALQRLGVTVLILASLLQALDALDRRGVEEMLGE